MRRLTTSMIILALVGIFAVTMPHSAIAQNSQSGMKQSGGSQMGDMSKSSSDQTALSNQFQQLADNNKMISLDIDKLRTQATKMKAEKDQTKLQSEIQDYQTLWAQVQQKIQENQQVFNQTYSSITGQQPMMNPEGGVNDNGTMNNGIDHNQMKNQMKTMDTTKTNNPSGY